MRVASTYCIHRLHFRRVSISASRAECLPRNGPGVFLPCSISTLSFFSLAALSARPSSIPRLRREGHVSSETSSLPLVRFCRALAEPLPVRLRGGLVYHGVHWTHVHLLWLLHDEEGSLRIFACKSADLGRVAFAQLIRVLVRRTSAR
jgi:hypothetical protein